MGHIDMYLIHAPEKIFSAHTILDTSAGNKGFGVTIWDLRETPTEKGLSTAHKYKLILSCFNIG